MSNFSSSDVGRDQESFPLSSFDYKSSLVPCDDDDDDEKNDADAYIEIELEPAKTLTPGTRENKGKTDEDEDEKVEFRLSFSTVYRKSSSANMFSFPATYSGDPSDSTAASKTVTIFPPTWKRKRLEPSVDDEDFQSNEYEQSATINLELLKSRKAPKATGIMKMLVKFKSISFRSMLTSLRKVGKFTPTTAKTQQVYVISEVRAENRRSSLNPFDKLFPPKARKGSRTGDRSKLLEINLEGIRKLFDTVGIKTANQTRQAKSCPNSIKSSPINDYGFYSRENSVQAAIAHLQMEVRSSPFLSLQLSETVASMGVILVPSLPDSSARVSTRFAYIESLLSSLDKLRQAVGRLGLNSDVGDRR